MPQRLRLPHVPDPGNEPLVEEGFADGAVRTLATEVPEHAVELRGVGENVGAEPHERAPVKLEDGAIPEHCLALGSAEDEPGTAAPWRAAANDLPPPGHPEVAADDHAPFEPQQQVFPGGVDGDETTSVDPRRDAREPAPRVRRLGLETLADERAELACGTVERVAFRHGRTVAEAAVRRGFVVV
jgi:hypothetical protein